MQQTYQQQPMQYQPMQQQQSYQPMQYQPMQQQQSYQPIQQPMQRPNGFSPMPRYNNMGPMQTPSGIHKPLRRGGVAGRIISMLDGPPFGFYLNILAIIVVMCIIMWLIYEYACDIPGINILCMIGRIMYTVTSTIYSVLSWILHIF